ncbi:hypothetical protein Q1695_002688 [Nippostrongylus brasiliensis]|nr:hypothetical protein Q1695_002688 [Nippostrongylus brasiliensis]
MQVSGVGAGRPVGRCVAEVGLRQKPNAVAAVQNGTRGMQTEPHSLTMHVRIRRSVASASRSPASPGMWPSSCVAACNHYIIFLY